MQTTQENQWVTPRHTQKEERGMLGRKGSAGMGKEQENTGGGRKDRRTPETVTLSGSKNKH